MSNPVARKIARQKRAEEKRKAARIALSTYEGQQEFKRRQKRDEKVDLTDALIFMLELRIGIFERDVVTVSDVAIQLSGSVGRTVSNNEAGHVMLRLAADYPQQLVKYGRRFWGRPKKTGREGLEEEKLSTETVWFVRNSGEYEDGAYKVNVQLSADVANPPHRARAMAVLTELNRPLR